MKTFLHSAVLAALATLAMSAHAAPWQPADADADAFIESYSFESLKTLAEEALTFSVESGKISPELAACARDKLPMRELLPALRPIVATSFSSDSSLKQATGFFLSSTGIKLKNYGIKTLRDTMHAKLHGQQPPKMADLPPDFNRADMASTNAFNTSAAGKEFSKFVTEGLPKMPKVNLIAMAVNECTRSGVSGAAQKAPAP